jgi:hypothetical protein
MKSFFSRHFTTLVIVLFVAAGMFRMNIFSFGSRTPGELKKGDFFVYQHSAIHALYYQGDFSDSILRKVAQFMDVAKLFKDKKPAVLGLIKSNDSLKLLRMTTEEYKKEMPKEVLYVYGALGLAVKKDLYPGLKIVMQFTDKQWVPHKTLTEQDMEELLRQFSDVNPAPPAANSTPAGGIEAIMNRWGVGASSISQAQYYFPVEGNDNWRIYYAPALAEQVKELSKALFDGGYYAKDRANFTAFYTQASPEYFNGEASYVLAIPFTEEQLNGKEASRIIEMIDDYLKKGYFKEVHLMIVATDYDFKPALIKYTR